MSEQNTLHYTTLHYNTLHYTTLHYNTLHCILHYTTLHYTTLHYTTLHYTTLHYTTLHYITLHYTTLHYTTLYYTTLHYTTLQYNTLHCTMLHYTIDAIPKREDIGTFNIKSVVFCCFIINESLWSNVTCSLPWCVKKESVHCWVVLHAIETNTNQSNKVWPLFKGGYYSRVATTKCVATIQGWLLLKVWLLFKGGYY